MTTALWAIVACQVIRIIQNAMQLKTLHKNVDSYDAVCDEFIKNLNRGDQILLKKLIEEINRGEDD